MTKLLKRSTVRGACCCALACMALLPRVSPAQTPQDERNRDKDTVGTLKVQVDVVNVFFNVKDKKGLLIPNLTKDGSRFPKTARRRPSSILPPKPISR